MDEVPRFIDGTPFVAPEEWDYAIKQRNQGVATVTLSNGSTVDFSLQVRQSLIHRMVRFGLMVTARWDVQSIKGRSYVMVPEEMVGDLRTAIMAYLDSLPDPA